MNAQQNVEGGCTCRQVRYRLIGTPLIVHACHCRWCQRETGTAHALNALYEADRVVHTAGEPEIVVTPSASGKGQKIARCPTCRVAVWSNYPQAGPAVRFVRVGTMDNPNLCPPDIHIYTSSMQPWVTLPPGACYRRTCPPTGWQHGAGLSWIATGTRHSLPKRRDSR